jgi:uncharacterized integral membrane protein
MSGPALSSRVSEPAVRGAAAHEPQVAPLPGERPVETRGARWQRTARRGRLRLSGLLGVALLICVVALVLANTAHVRLHWLLGSGTASLAWIVLLSAVLGWLLGLVSASLVRWRTRAPRRPSTS